MWQWFFCSIFVSAWRGTSFKFPPLKLWNQSSSLSVLPPFTTSFTLPWVSGVEMQSIFIGLKDKQMLRLRLRSWQPQSLKLYTSRLNVIKRPTMHLMPFAWTSNRMRVLLPTKCNGQKKSCLNTAKLGLRPKEMIIFWYILFLGYSVWRRLDVIWSFIIALLILIQ